MILFCLSNISNEDKQNKKGPIGSPVPENSINLEKKKNILASAKYLKLNDINLHFDMRKKIIKKIRKPSRPNSIVICPNIPGDLVETKSPPP